jgi:hypothetical protein
MGEEEWNKRKEAQAVAVLRDIPDRWQERRRISMSSFVLCFPSFHSRNLTR